MIDHTGIGGADVAVPLSLTMRLLGHSAPVESCSFPRTNNSVSLRELARAGDSVTVFIRAVHARSEPGFPDHARSSGFESPSLQRGVRSNRWFTYPTLNLVL
jgi:hypothetical protein